MKKINEIKSTNLRKKNEKKVYDAAAELSNKQFEKYYDDYDQLSDVEKNKLNLKFKPMIIRDTLQKNQMIKH